jgi:hypothetical protein
MAKEQNHEKKQAGEILKKFSDTSGTMPHYKYHSKSRKWWKKLANEQTL